MNKVYRQVWSVRLGAVIAVAETARSRSKTSGGVAGVLLASVLLAGAAQAQTVAVDALPSGAQVTAGAAAISQIGNTLNINQSSQRAAINWQSFNIGANASVQFTQPNAAAVVLNRVTGNEGSVINGALTANGQVFVINPNGVLFGQGARVDTAGLVASTRDISTADFMAGKSTFSGTGSGTVVNQGQINAADGGYVALIGQQVSNSGTISARLGTVAMAAGNQVSLNFNGSSLVGVTIDQGALDSLVANGGAVLADGGTVLLTAKAASNLLDGMVNDSGEIRAQTIGEHAGKIVLLGDMTQGTTTVTGTLDASAPNGGNGGFIETSAASVKIGDTAQVTTAAASGQTGQWLIDPTDYTIASSGGDITGATLASQLASNNVTIQTSSGSSGTSGDLYVNDAVSWSANTTLTLDAQRNIYIDKAITATGSSGKLALQYGQATTNGTVNSVASDYYVYAPISLQAGQNFSTQLGSSGTVENYMVVTSLGTLSDTTDSTLLGITRYNGTQQYIALGADIDASAITYTGSVVRRNVSGGTPIAVFTGLGHTVSNITINDNPSYGADGFFGFSFIPGNLTVRDLALNSVTIHAGASYAGALVGEVQDSFSAIGVSVTGLNINGGQEVGGLIGDISITNPLTLERVSTAGTLTANVNTTFMGGLVGHIENLNGAAISISDAYSRVDLIGNGSSVAGGLVGGFVSGTLNISNSYYAAAMSSQSTSSAFLGVWDAQGIVGNNATVNVSNSFWDGSLAGSPTSAAPSTGSYTDPSTYVTVNLLTNLDATSASSSTTAQMTSSSTYTSAGWNFSATGNGVWKRSSSVNDGYPVLLSAWEPSTTALTLTLPSSLTMTYGDTVLPSLSSLVLSGCNACVSINWGSAVSSTTHAGSYAYASTADIFTLTWGNGVSASDYSLTLPTGSLVVLPRTLSLSVNSGATRSYDATSSAGASLFSLSGTVNNDSVALSGAATLDSVHVGTRSITSLGSLALSDSDYALPTSLPSGTVTVTPAQLGVSVAARAYDGTTNDAANVAASAVATGDTVTFSGVSAVLDSANAGSRTATVNIGGFTVSGVGSSSDYSMSSMTGLQVATTVTPKDLTLTGATVAAKVYDGTTTGSATGGTLSGLVGSETLGYAPTVVFTSANAGATAQVGATLTDGSNGGLASNYTVVLTPDSTAITPRVVQAGKVYDGSTTFTGSSLVVQNLVTGDIVTATGSGTLSGANAGTQTLASAGTLALSNSNYTLNGSSFIILQRPVDVATTNSSSRVYDGSTNVASTLLQITNIVGSDSVSLSGDGSLAAAGVGSRALSGVSGLTLTGSDAGNYTLVGATPSGSVTITARPVSVVAINNASKVYDGSATLAASDLQISNVAGSDAVSLSGSATLAGAGVGTQGVTGVSGLTLTGADAANYTLTGASQSGSATITARPVIIATTNGATRVYDGTTTADTSLLQITNVAGSDNVTLSGSAALASANAGTEALTGLSGLTLTGSSASNYTLTGSIPSGNVIITARPVTVSTTNGATRVYDGTTTASTSLLQITNVAGSDNVTLSGSAALASANAGTEALNSLSGLTLTGSSASNYTLTGSTQSGNVTITARPVTIATTSGATRVYDGTTTASTSLLQITNVAGSDNVTLSGSAALASANAGTEALTGLSGLTLTGSSASNYTLTGSTQSGNVTITARPVTISAASNATRVYDGTTEAATSLLQVGNVVGSDNVGLTGYATLAAKGVGTQALSAGTLALGNSNYVLSPNAVSGSVAITPRQLQVNFEVTSKVFDGSTTASAQTTDNRVTGDQIGINFNAAFADTTVGTGKPVTISGLSLSGADAGNYQLASSAGQGVTGNLTARPITYTLASATPSKVYMADGSDLVSASALDQLVLVSWANTVTGTAPGTLSYTIWKDGVQVQSIRDAGNYEIRAAFATADPHYAIAGLGNTMLQIVVQDNLVQQVIAQATRSGQQTNLAPAMPMAPEAQHTAGGVSATPPNVVFTPMALESTFGQGTALALLSAPTTGESSEGVMMEQARQMMRAPATNGSTTGTPDIRVPISRNSLAEIVNGGVKLPGGVDQLLFVVKAN